MVERKLELMKKEEKEQKNPTYLKGVFLILLLILPHFLEFLDRIISNGSTCMFAVKDVCKIFFRIILDNIEYYGILITLYLGAKQFVEESKQKEEEKIIEYEKQEVENRKVKEKEQELRSKELENYKDSFRPSFFENEDGKYLEVIMRNNYNYLDNVIFYKSNDSEGKKYNSLNHMNKIDLQGAKSNYFVTAETQIKEKIIFGKLYGGIKIYKVLKDAGDPIRPNDFNNDIISISKIINENWKTFNDTNIIENLDDAKNNIDNIDIYFMRKTVEIREKMIFNIEEYIKNIIKKEDIVDLLKYTFDLMPNEIKFNNNKVLKILINLALYFNEYKIYYKVDFDENFKNNIRGINKLVDQLENENKKIEVLSVSDIVYNLPLNDEIYIKDIIEKEKLIYRSGKVVNLDRIYTLENSDGVKLRITLDDFNRTIQRMDVKFEEADNPKNKLSELKDLILKSID